MTALININLNKVELIIFKKYKQLYSSKPNLTYEDIKSLMDSIKISDVVDMEPIDNYPKTYEEVEDTYDNYDLTLFIDTIQARMRSLS